MVNPVFSKVLLKWTGHPLVDCGIAAICAMLAKQDPEELTLEDLDRAADEMADYYFSGIMTSYNSCVFTMNAYDNPSSSPDYMREYESRILRAHRYVPKEKDIAYRCAFSGEPAYHLIERRQMPLLTGEDVMNFYPEGKSALPVSGAYVVALQALPLGGRRVEGKLLIVHTDLPEATLAFAKHYLADNRRIIGLAKAGSLPGREGPSPDLEREHAAWDSKKKRPKFPDAKAAETLIAADLTEIWCRRGRPEYASLPVSITAYWLSNSGQGPSLEIFFIPAQITRFLSIVNEAAVGEQWRRIVAKGWRSPKEKEGEQAVEKKGPKGKGRGVSNVVVQGGAGRSRNDVLSDLFAIYENGFVSLRAASSFVKKYLLRNFSRFMQGRDEAAADGFTTLKDRLVYWSLTEVFLKEVMGVDEHYTEKVRQFADRLADHINRKNDKGLFRSIVFSGKPWELRRALAKAQRNQAKEQNKLLFGLQEYLDVFEADHAVERLDWSLVRDLISIRVVEQLFNNGFFNREGNDELLEDHEEEVKYVNS